LDFPIVTLYNFLYWKGLHKAILARWAHLIGTTNT
jgi:hypothetical protein